MEKTQSMKDKALNKIEAKIKFLLLEVRALQDEITGKRVKPMGITNAVSYTHLTLPTICSV